MRNPMFVYDERLTDLIFDYCRGGWPSTRCRSTSAGRGRRSTTLLEGLIGAEGNDPRHVLELFADQLADGGDLVRQPALPLVHPRRPHQGRPALRHGGVCSSLQGTSWLEAAGAVAAENQALGGAGRSGRPPRRSRRLLRVGGLHRQPLRPGGGPRHGRPPPRAGAPRRPRMAISEEAHSSVGKALHVIGVEPLAGPDRRPPPDRGGAPGGARRPTRRRPTRWSAWWPPPAPPTPGSSTTWPGWPPWPPSARLWFHVDAAYGGAGLLAPSVRHRFAGIEQADSFIVDPHKWLFAPFDCAALLYREPRAGQGGPHPGRLLPRRSSTGPGGEGRRRRAVEPERLRHPPHPAGPGAAAVVLAGRARHRRLPRTPSRPCWHTARRAAELIAATPHLSSWSASPSCRWCCSAATAGTAPTTRPGRPDCWPTRSGFVTPTTWEGEPVGPVRLPPPRHHPRDGAKRSWPPWPERRRRAGSSASVERAASLQQGIARLTDGCAGQPPPAPGHPRQGLEDHPVGQVGRDLGVVVGGRHLHHVDAGHRQLHGDPPHGVEQLPAGQAARLGRAGARAPSPGRPRRRRPRGRRRRSRRWRWRRPRRGRRRAPGPPPRSSRSCACPARPSRPGSRARASSRAGRSAGTGRPAPPPTR